MAKSFIQFLKQKIRPRLTLIMIIQYYKMWSSCNVIITKHFLIYFVKQYYIIVLLWSCCSFYNMCQVYVSTVVLYGDL